MKKMERAEIFIAGRIKRTDGSGYKNVTVIVNPLLVDEYNKSDHSHFVTGTIIYTIKHCKNYIYYELFDDNINTLSNSQAGSICIGMIVPIDKPFVNKQKQIVSPYTVITKVYTFFCDKYTKEGRNGKRDFVFDYNKPWFDKSNYGILTNEVYNILAEYQYPLDGDYKPRTDYVIMNPAGKVGRLKIKENELGAFFLDSHDTKFKDYSAIQFSTDYAGETDLVYNPPGKQQIQNTIEAIHDIIGSDTNATTLPNDADMEKIINDLKNNYQKQIDELIKANTKELIEAKRVIKSNDKTIKFCVDKTNELLELYNKDKVKKTVSRNDEESDGKEDTGNSQTKDESITPQQELETNFEAISKIISAKKETISKKILIALASLAAVLLIAVIVLAINMDTSVPVAPSKNDGGSYVKVLSYISNSKSFMDTLRVKRKKLDDTLKSLNLREDDINLALFYLEEYPTLPQKKQITIQTQTKENIQVDIVFPKVSLSDKLSWSELQRKYDEMNSIYRVACQNAEDSVKESLTVIKTVKDLLKVFCMEGLSDRVINSDSYKNLGNYEKLCMSVIKKSGQLPIDALTDLKALKSLAEKISQDTIVAVVNDIPRPNIKDFKKRVDEDYRKVWNNPQAKSYTDNVVELILAPYSYEEKLAITKGCKDNGEFLGKDIVFEDYMFKSVQDIKNKARVINILKNKGVL